MIAGQRLIIEPWLPATVAALSDAPQPVGRAECKYSHLYPQLVRDGYARQRASDPLPQPSAVRGSQSCGAIRLVSSACSFGHKLRFGASAHIPPAAALQPAPVGGAGNLPPLNDVPSVLVI